MKKSRFGLQCGLAKESLQAIPQIYLFKARTL